MVVITSMVDNKDQVREFGICQHLVVVFFFFLQVLSLALFVSVMFGAIVPRKHKSQVFLCLWHNDFKIREQSF